MSNLMMYVCAYCIDHKHLLITHYIIYNFSLLEEIDHLKEKDKGNIQNYFSTIVAV